jgi:acetyl esterase
MISAHDREILKGLPEWNPTGDIAAQRRAWEELAVTYNQDLPAIGGFEKNVALRAGLTADVAVPKGAGPHPVMVYLHGGGWAFGSPASFRKLGMQFAEAGYLTIVLDYRLAPEHPFPAAFEDTILPSNGRATTRGGGTATGRASPSAAIPPAATCR